MTPRETNTKGDAHTVRLLLGRLCSDPWRKGAAIVVAVLLWYFLDGQITKTKEVVCQLHVVDAAETVMSAADPGQSVMDVRIPGRQFSYRQFRDATATERELTEVTLYFSGPKRVIARIAEEHFWVLATRLKPGATSFVFDRAHVEMRKELRDAMESMSPSSVRVEIEPNKEKQVPLSPQNVRFERPAAANGHADLSRLMIEDARFRPGTARFWGTESNLDKIPLDGNLFELILTSLKNEDLTGTEYEAPIYLLDHIAGLVEEWEPELPRIVIPLRPEWQEHSLEVPVALDLENSSYTEQQLEAVPDHKVKFKAAGTLATELRLKSQLELATWARDNLRVLAYMPPDRDPTRAIEGRLIFLQKHGWQENRDFSYEMLSINLELKK